MQNFESRKKVLNFYKILPKCKVNAENILTMLPVHGPNKVVLCRERNINYDYFQLTSDTLESDLDTCHKIFGKNFSFG